MKAIWNGTTLADSDRTVMVEGNHYFPAQDVRQEYLSDSQTRSSCPWKGQASYKAVTVEGQTLADAAWYYPAPLQAATHIKDHYAFWNGVEVVES